MTSSMVGRLSDPTQYSNGSGMRQSLWMKFESTGATSNVGLTCGNLGTTISSNYNANYSEETHKRKPVSRGDGLLKLFMGNDHREKIKQIYA